MTKRIVILFDGTWNTPEQDDNGDAAPTNVVRFRDSVASVAQDGKEQGVWYDKGVGTKWYTRVLGGAFGVGLSRNIRQGYEHLARHYQDGDDVYILGFSRGAYSARSLVGFIRKCGLLRKEYVDKMLDDAYDLYRNRDETPDTTKAVEFRREHSNKIGIKFIGVWDTVGALGIPIESFEDFNKDVFDFHDTGLSRIVENAFHAIAVDENRKPYQATLWENIPPGRRVEQQWFAGAHCNVGGGYSDSTLSDTTLRWMQDRAVECGLELTSEKIVTPRDQTHLGESRDSFAEFLGGKYAKGHDRFFRPIGEAPNGNEVVDQTVLDRRDAKSGYRPSNLEEFIRKSGGVSL